MGFDVVWDSAGFTVYTKGNAPSGENTLRVGTPFKSPCAGVAYLNKLANESDGGLVPEERGNIELLMDLCRQSQPPGQAPPAPPKPKPTPPKATSETPTPPTQQETPGSLGAPNVPAAGLVAREPTETQSLAQRPSDQHFDQDAPQPSEDVVIIVAPSNATTAQLEEINSRILHNRPEPKQPHPNLSGETAQKPAKDGDPVDLCTGTFTIAITDLEVPTPTIPIRMVRRYRSGRPYFGPFGFSWDHGYNMHVRALADGSIALWTGELWEYRFRPVGGGYEPQRGLTAALKRLPGLPDVFEVRHPQGLTWRFERPAGWTHAEHIPLTRISDRHGNTLQLAYNARNQLASVMDGAGRGLRFAYGGCGLLESVSDHTGGRTVRYHHAAEIEHLVEVVLPPTAGHPAGIRIRYDYDDTNPHPAMRHNILRIADTHDRTTIENTYAGPEAGWAFNAVTRQVMGGFEYRFEYEPIQYVPANDLYADLGASRTVVHRPDGSVQVYTFNYRGDLLDHRFRLNADGSGRIVAIRRRFDAEGNPVETVAPDGLRTVRTYDATNPDPCARRNLLRVELAAPVPNVTPSRTVFTATYDPVYQLPRRVLDERGAETRFRYDFDLGMPNATGRMVRIELPAVTLANGGHQQSIVRLEQNGHGQLRAVVMPEGGRTEIEYLNGGLQDGFLHRVIDDANGDRLTTEYAYDAAGHLSSISEPGGRVSTLRHNALGLLEEHVPPAVAGVAAGLRQWFDDNGSLVRVERPRGTYADPVIQGSHIVDEYERDLLGAVKHARLALNTARPREWRQQPDATGRPVSIWDASGVRTDCRYDERGLLLRQRYGVGTAEEITRFAYDRAGRLVRSVDAAGRVTTRDYDLWGRLARVVLPNGAARILRWGPGDRLLESRVEGSSGPGAPPRVLEKTTYAYDERGRLRSETRWSFRNNPATAVPLTTLLLYDAEDNLRAVTLPRGAQIACSYDAVGRLALLTDETGNTRAMAYGADGNMSGLTAHEPGPGAGQSTSRAYQYDARGRLAGASAAGLARTFDYDDRDLLIAESDPLGRVARFTTDPHGALTAKLRDATGLAPLSRWEYDASGGLSRFIDPTGEATAWAPDAGVRSHRLELPDQSVWRRSVKPAARQVEQRLPSGSTILLTFGTDADLPAEMSCVEAPGVAPVSTHQFAYDGLGRLVRTSNAAGVITRAYDSLGRLVEESASGKTTRAEYDDLTGDIDLVFPDGRRERTSCDPLGRPTRVVLIAPGTLGGTAGDVLLEMAYTSSGRASVWTFGNGVTSSFAYDESGRTIRVEHARGASLLDVCRTRHDAEGHRKAVQLGGTPARTTVHAFDALGRLVGARWNGAVVPLADVRTQAEQDAQIAVLQNAVGPGSAWHSYTLDLADSRTALTTPAGATAYGQGPGHRLVAAGPATLTYHADGHRRTDDRFAYDVDALGRTVRVRDAATGTVRAELTYDALSRPASGALAGTPFTRAFFGGAWVEESRPALPTARQQSPHPFGDAPFLVLDSTGVHYVHLDDGLSTMCVTDATGAVLERHRHDPFGVLSRLASDGVTVITTGAADAIWRGMPLLGATGLYATPRRLYDPEHGVFLSRDRLLYADSASPYAFAGHNPVDFADPSGWSKAPLGRAANPPEEHGEVWKWFYRQTRGWYRDRPEEGDIFPQLPPVETGWLAWDYVENYQISVYNLTASLVNAPFKILLEFDKLMLRSPIAVEWSSLQYYMPVEQLPLFAAESIAYLSGWLSRSRILSRLAQFFRFAKPVVSTPQALPVVRLHYTPHMAVEPGHANWMRCNLEWVMQEMGYFIKGDRALVPEDKSLRGLARRYMKRTLDLDGLQAGHPIDEAAGGAFRRHGQVGSTYYFMDENVNREFGRQLGTEQSRLGINVGDRFQIVFEGNWPSYQEYPPIAPPASPPGLQRRR